ncbi:hypothetical protein K8R42_01320 [bacterium]|nr:hypothetical protein [bacterium]
MSAFKSKVALVAGTGGLESEKLLAEFPGFDVRNRVAQTPYGPVHYQTVKGNGTNFFLIDRHHFTGNPQFPHMIRPGAFLYFLLVGSGVECFVSGSSVGLNLEVTGVGVGDLIVPDSYMDLPGMELDICPPSGVLPQGFKLARGHCSPEGVICPHLIKVLDPTVVHHDKGFLACTAGPLFETDPEKDFYLKAGASFLGMHTVIREWRWATLLNVHFLPILNVTNIISIGKGDTGEENEDVAYQAYINLLEQFFRVVKALPQLDSQQDCRCLHRRERNIFVDLGF